jgi:hypothetical protein
MIRWLSRCIPGLSAIGLITLLVLAFTNAEQPRFYILQQDRHSSQELRLSQIIFIFYTLLLHIDTACLAIRLCFSILIVKKKIRTTLLRRNDIPSGFYSEGILQPTDAQELKPRSPQFDPDRPRLNEAVMSEVLHAIVIPNYSEDIDTLRMTLAVLAAHPRARTQYEVSP